MLKTRTIVVKVNGISPRRFLDTFIVKANHAAISITEEIEIPKINFSFLNINTLKRRLNTKDIYIIKNIRTISR